MAYLSFWQAFTYRKAMAKKSAVKKSMTTSCMRRASFGVARLFEKGV